MISSRIRALCATALLAVAGAASAAYPDKPITLIVPWAPGGSTDILARALGERMTKALGQPVIVDNRAGASGNIGSNIVAKARPDGYTLLVGSMSTHAMNPALMASMPFKGVEDFTPIAQLANVINTMVVSTSVPANNLKDFIAYAKANPGKLNYASAGQGSTNHLSAVLFEKAAGVTMVHVPYKGGAPAVVDTVADQTQVLFSAGTQTLPHVKSGKLKLLAVTEAKRSALMPEGVPTVGETLPGYELGVWYGLFGPANMPKDLVDRLNAVANAAMADPAVKARMDSLGVEVVKTTPAQFAAVLKSDADRYGKIIRELGIKGE
ncbi:Bug family tripartite tricarboxylate transporter substrate binding protein [Comamonas endophytica]|uniref:Tripartite tricarboxylate transporter substrate binding protein n=1 Tax=Comamonas endophytica TaxID=2949090 RepID=A0ABY6G9E3_9BURK|nr:MULTISPECIES: tripartite tricarboxylate transporter substrate binding protein [unclassified Acidovorax]MCD2514236.1 tripartite tricarboxylate transporter substrate binding protein [Acidovorax sp. D4N7]UYG51375.1 tripartite tricarboxylate transporter substrate binding protein [Acidovorax sp. 5MLIR]